MYRHIAKTIGLLFGAPEATKIAADSADFWGIRSPLLIDGP